MAAGNSIVVSRTDDAALLATTESGPLQQNEREGCDILWTAWCAEDRTDKRGWAGRRM
jgi:hypothetical protein